MGKQFLSKNYYVFIPNSTGLVFDKRLSGERKREETIMSEGLVLDNLDNKIKIYQDRVNGWFLDFATALTRKRDAGFVILSLAIGYIEGNQQFRDGSLSENKSCPFFIKGMRRIFDKALVPEKILKSYYKQIRCGLFHDGMTKKDVSISRDYPYPVDYRDGKITINPTKFLEKIKEDLVNYISELAHNETLRRNFESRRNLENKNGR